MKIAFVGKGGSGKSTTTSLFIQYLIKKNKKVLAVDADINMHISSLLGIYRNSDLALSEPTNVEKIREYLKGKNEKIKKASHVVKTTPPGKGSSLIFVNDEDYMMKNFSTKFDKNGFYMFVGTYDTDEIGIACYHTNLAIFENVLSHLVLGEKEWLVADMVAGTDAFSNTLHAQFDAIVLVIEPTPEGTSVYEQYIKLAKEAGVDENLYVIGNKIEDESDLAYLNKKIGNKLLGGFTLKKEIKQARQKDTPLDLSMITKEEMGLFDKISLLVERKGEDRQKKLRLLHDLHRKYVAQDYIVKEHGDLTDQVDVTFVYPQK
ncbi:MAG TPA: AAA family ATPase [Patescibacteria group bacterium]|nr:AAA family ATPase [Patescibacteria group bacterium]